jgi:hypothetical protein
MPLSVYVLLDRAGSMANVWAEALGAVNGFAKGLAQRDARVTLVCFDAMKSLVQDFVRDRVRPEEWRAVAPEEAPPRGRTPLNDAVGRLCAWIRADTSPRGMVVIVTNGYEDASRTFTKETARAALEAVRKRGWDVCHVGIDFDARQQAANYGTPRPHTLLVTRQTLASGAVAKVLAGKAERYAASGVSPEFSDADRAATEQRAWR